MQSLAHLTLPQKCVLNSLRSTEERWRPHADLPSLFLDPVPKHADRPLRLSSIVLFIGFVGLGAWVLV